MDKVTKTRGKQTAKKDEEDVPQKEKKTTAAAKQAEESENGATTKGAKAKRTKAAPKNEPEVEAKAKPMRTRGAPAAVKEPVDSENGTTKPSKGKKAKAAAATADEEPVDSENVAIKTYRGKRPKAVAAAVAEEPEDSESGATKTSKTRKAKAKSEEKEAPPSKGRRAKKEPEEAVEAKAKAPKRKPAKTEEEEPSKKTRAKEEPTKKAAANATITDWDAVNFDCDAKTESGKPPNKRIISWNVDGMRAWLKKGGLEILQRGRPDVLCLQETKCSQEKVPEELGRIEGYEAVWCSSEKEGYAGVGIISKDKPLSVTEGIGSEEHDEEGRCLTAEFESFYVVNVYVPNAGRKLVTLPKRLEWNKLFKEYVKGLDEKKAVIVCGDMNVAHTEIDLANPKTNTKNAGFTPEEREGMTEFLEDGYVDTFRKLYPTKEKAYTFWTYMANSRVKNVGWRLDYFIVSERFMKNVCDSVILNEVLGSDHCPICLHFNV